MRTMADTILIHLGECGWLATYQGPHAGRIAALFDCCTLPLPYTAQTPLVDVLANIAARNPDCTVAHWDG